jgi:hypothetical protein
MAREEGYKEDDRGCCGQHQRVRGGDVEEEGLDEVGGAQGQEEAGGGSGEANPQALA